jgi:hypothetical protein
MQEIWYRLFGETEEIRCLVTNMAVFADAVERKLPISVLTPDRKKTYYVNTHYVVTFGVVTSA